MLPRMPVQTTCVGSWPIPFGKRLALKRYYAGQLSDAEAHDLLQQAAQISMDEMIACGLDQIMGGEVFAPDFVHHVPPRLSGLDTLSKRDTRKGYGGIGRYQIVGDISAPRGTGHALAYRRERAIESRLDKAAVPSPLTMTLGLERDPRLAEQLPNYAEVVRAEVLDMIDAGVREVQLDAPVEATAMVNASLEVEEILESLTVPFRDQGGITRSIHFCLGDISRKPGTEIQNLVSLIPLIQALEGYIDRVHVECSYAGQWADRAMLADLPESMQIIAGIADVKRSPQSVDALREKIESLLAVVPEERLLVSSSCGCGRVPHDEAIRLMRNLVKAAGGD